MFKKYFRRNWATKNHPSIVLGENERTWSNLEMTTSPTNKNRYIQLDKNPDSRNPKVAYVRKYVRNDRNSKKGRYLPHFKLSSNDEKKVDSYLTAHSKRISKQKNKHKKS